MRKMCECRILVMVDDAQDLFEAAVANGVATCGESREDAIARLTDGDDIDIEACIQQLLDPGVSPQGLSIEESSCVRITP